MITVHILSSTSRSKDNQTMKSAKFLKYNTTIIFLEKPFGKCDGETSTRPYSKKSKLSKSLLNFVHFILITCPSLYLISKL